MFSKKHLKNICFGCNKFKSICQQNKFQNTTYPLIEKYCNGNWLFVTLFCLLFFSVDATEDTGRLGRLVNHSKTMPNLKPIVMGLKNAPRLVLFAKQDINVGEELLVDYGDRSKESLAAFPWLAT